MISIEVNVLISVMSNALIICQSTYGEELFYFNTEAI